MLVDSKNLSSISFPFHIYIGKIGLTLLPAPNSAQKKRREGKKRRRRGLGGRLS
jgi:hypothetical protein